MILTQILQLNCIKVPLESKDKGSAISELVDLLDSNGLLLDKNAALDAVLMREQTRSTGIGSFAIPTAITSSLVAVHLPCGMAILEPIPVLRVCSRIKTASKAVFLSSNSPLLSSRSTNSDIADSLSLLSSGTLMQFSCNICVRIISGYRKIHYTS